MSGIRASLHIFTADEQMIQLMATCPMIYGNVWIRGFRVCAQTKLRTLTESTQWLICPNTMKEELLQRVIRYAVFMLSYAFLWFLLALGCQYLLRKSCLF